MFKDTVKSLLVESNENKEVILESIAINKTSKKIQRLINRIKKSTDLEPEVKDLVAKLTEVKEAFAVIENKYDSGDKEDIRKEYKDLQEKYSELLSTLNKEEVFSTLKKVGGLAVIAAAVTLGYFGIVTSGSIANSAILGKEIDLPKQGYEGSKEVVAKLLKKERILNFASRTKKLALDSKKELDKDSFLDAFGRKKAMMFSYEQGMRASNLLNAAGAINGVVYGTAAASSIGIVALFKKLGNMITKKNSLFYKTRDILDKIKKEEVGNKA